jgi:hypothetical protein
VQPAIYQGGGFHPPYGTSEMIRRDAKKGLASLCIGGGQGVALAIERE